MEAKGKLDLGSVRSARKRRVPLSYVSHAIEGLELVKGHLHYDRLMDRLICKAEIKPMSLSGEGELKKTYVLQIIFRYKALEKKVRFLWWGASSRPFTLSDYEKRKSAFITGENEHVVLISVSWVLPEVYHKLRRLGVQVIILNYNFAPRGLTRERILEAYEKAQNRFREGYKIWVKKHSYLGFNRVPRKAPLLVNRFEFQKRLSLKLRRIVGLIRNSFGVFYPEIKDWWLKYADLIKRLKYALNTNSKSYERYISKLLRQHLNKWEDKPPPIAS